MVDDRAEVASSPTTFEVLMALLSVAAVAAAEALDQPRLWLLVLACGVVDAVLALRRVRRVTRSPRARQPAAWLSPALLGVLAGGLVTWGGLQLSTPAECPAVPPRGIGFDGFQQPTASPNAIETDLTFCVVDVDEGGEVGAEYSLEGTVLGEVPRGRRLVLVTRSDPDTCATDGSRGTGGFQLQDPDEPSPNFRFDTTTGRWRFNGRVAYPPQITIRYRYYLAVATEEAMNMFRNDKTERTQPDGSYAGMDALPLGTDPLVHFDLQRELPDPPPTCDA